MYSDRSIINNQPTLTPTNILCCLCGKQIQTNQYNTCFVCLTKKIDIAEGIPSKATVHYCRQCDRYLHQNNKWFNCKAQSRELLQLCLSKLNALKFVKIIETGWIYTDVSDAEFKINLNIQKEVLNSVLMTKDVLVTFEIVRVQCDECRRSFTPHMYTCKVQVRQHAIPHELKRNMLFLEQLILKHNAQTFCNGVETTPEGVDFKFNDIKYGQRFVNFLKSVMPCKYDIGREQIGFNEQNNEYRYKTNFSVNIAPLNKDELIAVDKKLCKQLGISLGFYLCWRVTTYIHLINPLNMHRIDLSSEKYFDVKDKFLPCFGRSQLRQYMVLEVERDYHNVIQLKSHEMDDVNSVTSTLKNKNQKGHLYNQSASGLSIYNSAWSQSTTKIMKRLQKMVHSWVTIAQLEDQSKIYYVKSHLGNILKEGDTVLGYDMEQFNISESVIDTSGYNPADFQSVYLVKKLFVKKRKRNFKLKRLTNNIDEEGLEEEFIGELETDPELRSRINLYKDAKSMPLDPIKEEPEKKETDLDKDKDKDNQEWDDVEVDEEDDVEVNLCELIEDMEITNDSQNLNRL